MSESSYWTRKRLGRRALLRGAGLGIAGLGAAALIGCSGEDEAGAPAGAAPAPGKQVDASFLTNPADTTKAAVRGGVYPEFNASDPGSLDYLAQFTGAGAIGVFPHEMLLQPKPGYLAKGTNDVEPLLAEKYEYVEPTRLILTLRPNVKWDARPPTSSRVFNSEDVLFTWGRFSKESTYRSELNNATSDVAPIIAVEAPDAKTVVMKTKRPDSTLLLTLGARFFSMSPKEATATGANSYDPKKEARGTGAYFLDDRQPNVRAVFKRNPNYWKADRPFIDEIQQYVIGEYAQQLSQFSNAKIYNSPVLQTDMVETKKRLPALQLLQGEYANAADHIWWGFAPGTVFRDQRVRQAASMLLDRKLFQDVFNNVPGFEQAGWPVNRVYPTIGVSPYYEDVWINPEKGYTAAERKYLEFHPEESKKLLDAAGLKLPITVPFAISSRLYGADYNRRVEAYKGMFEAQGYFKFNVGVIDYTTDWIPKYVFNRGNQPGPFLSPSAAVSGPIILKYLFSYFHTDGTLQNVDLYQGAPVDGQAKSNEMLEQARATLGYKEQVKILQDWQHYMAPRAAALGGPGLGVPPFTLNWPWIMNVGVWRDNVLVSNNERWIDQKKMKELGF